MFNEIELAGKWWLPNQPEKRVSGKLTFSQEKGAVLELIDYFIDTPIPPDDTFDIILGSSSTGEPITLVNCYVKSSNISMQGFTTASIFANQLYLGANFQTKDDIKFNIIEISFHNLNEWVRVISFTETLRLDKQIIEYTPPKYIDFDLSEFKLQLGFKRSQSKLNSFKHVHIEQEAFFRFSFKEDIPIGEIGELSYHLTNFLTLAMGQPTMAISYVGWSNDIFEEIDGHNLPLEVKVYNQQIFQEIKPLRERSINFWLDDVNTINKRLSVWFKKQEELKPVNDLFFGETYRPASYAENRFLNMTQALEALHRRTVGNDLLNKSETRKVVSDFIRTAAKDLNPELVSRFKPRLKYSHEYFFSERLEALYKRIDWFNEDFLKKVKDTRNYLTHYDKELEEKSFQGTEIPNAAQSLKDALEKLLLYEIGVG